MLYHGLNFEALEVDIMGAYLRHFQHQGTHYLLGILYRSDSPLGPYEPRGEILFEPNPRRYTSGPITLALLPRASTRRMQTQ